MTLKMPLNGHVKNLLDLVKFVTVVSHKKRVCIPNLFSAL